MAPGPPNGECVDFGTPQALCVSQWRDKKIIALSSEAESSTLTWLAPHTLIFSCETNSLKDLQTEKTRNSFQFSGQQIDAFAHVPIEPISGTHIWQYDPSTNQVSLLFENALNSLISPDGNWIAFNRAATSSAPSQKPQLIVANLADKTRRVQNKYFVAKDLFWSADSKTLYALSEKTTKNPDLGEAQVKVFALDRETGQERLVIELSSETFGPPTLSNAVVPGFVYEKEGSNQPVQKPEFILRGISSNSKTIYVSIQKHTGSTYSYPLFSGLYTDVLCAVEQDTGNVHEAARFRFGAFLSSDHIWLFADR